MTSMLSMNESYEKSDAGKAPLVLVTGGAGFIGSHLVRALLSEGYAVRGLDDFSTGKRANIAAFLDHPNFELLAGDIRDAEICRKACEGVTYVFHEAAKASVAESMEKPELYEDVNIRGTGNLLEASRENGVRRFIFASSSAVYGEPPAFPLREGEESEPISVYARTKAEAEASARSCYEKYGLETIGLRYFNVFGPGQDPNGPYAAVIPHFIGAMRRGERPVIEGDGQQTRDFTAAADVVRANLLAMRAPAEKAAGKVYNIASGEEHSILELYEILAEAFGFTEGPIFGPPRKGDIRRSLASIERAREAFGYEPQADFREALTELLKQKTESLR